VWLLAKLFIVINIDRTFAAEVVVNKNNIVSEYSCALDASTCYLSDRGITSVAPDTFINHTNNFARIDLRGNQLSSIDLLIPTSLQELLLSDNQILTIDLSGITGLQRLELIRNNISVLPEGIFDSLTGLTNLEL
jgi:Leucine-rich repeat (LRR) protein